MTSLKKQGSFLVLGKLISFSTQLIIPIILIRLIDQNEYGFYQKLLTISILLFPFIDLYFKRSIYYFHPRLDQKEIKSFFSQTFFISFLAGIIIVVLLTLSSLLFDFGEKYNFNLLLLVVVYTLFFTTSNFIEVIFIVEKKSIQTLKYLIIDSLLKAFFILLPAYLFQSIQKIFIGLILYAFVECIFLYYYLKKNYAINLDSITISSFKKQSKYCKPLLLSEIVGKIGANADKYILLFMLSSSDYAIYSVGSFKLSFIIILYSSIGQVILPRLSELNKQGKFRDAFTLWKKMVKNNALVTIPVLIFFWWNANEFIEFIFTEKYSESTVVFRIVILSLLIQMLGHGYILRGFAENNNILKANIIRTLFSLIFGYILIDNFGMVGGALVFLISFTINALIQLRKTKKILKIDFIDFLPWIDFFKFFTISIIGLIPVLVLKSFNLNSFVFLTISAISFFSIVLILMEKLNYFNIKQLYNFLRKIDDEK